MPGFNQTGPMGHGSMTGRRMGRCVNLDANSKNQTIETEANINQNRPEDFQGRGFGFGRRGRGRNSFGMGRQNRFRGEV